MDGQVLKQASIDAGDKWSLANVLGAPLRAWDAVGHRTRVELDVLQRPTHVWVKKGSGAEWLATRVYYGESVTSPEDNNLRGKAVLTFDGAGVVETAAFDFKGNALSWSRRLATAITAEPDWTATASESTPSDALTAAASLLENETWTKAFAYDALNRVTSATMPDSSELLPSYNEAGLLGGVEVKIRGASTATAFVDDIDYDAHGRRTRIEYGNGTATEYFYDERTFRLTRIQTTRSADSKILQDLKYTYDPVGNIVEVRDDAHEDVFFNDAQVEPHQTFEYDALYRLVKATGREHAGGVGDLQRDHNDLPLWNLPHPNHAAALREYIEEYTYDKVGNILEFAHEGVGGPSAATWTRTYRYDTGVTEDYDNNRLHSTSEPGDAWASYTHDANGNMVAMPHLAAIDYTHRDQMRHADLGGGGDAYYTYDTGGERVRKFIQRIGTTTEERIYLDGWELYRKRVGSAQDIEVERETLHVMDDTRRIAMVETLTVEDEDPVSPAVPRIRYQYGNHLDSAMLECDQAGDVISYEEYHPYGTAAYRSARSGVEVSEKPYRYTGKERDEETGFSYHRWRYYAPWLARWTAADRAGITDGPNLYAYVKESPIVFRDPNGTETIYLGWSNASEDVARRQQHWGGKQYWSPEGSQGAGWYVRIEGNRVVENPDQQLRQGKTTVEHVPPTQENVAVLDSNPFSGVGWRASLQGTSIPDIPHMTPPSVEGQADEPSSVQLHVGWSGKSFAEQIAASFPELELSPPDPPTIVPDEGLFNLRLNVDTVSAPDTYADNALNVPPGVSVDDNIAVALSRPSVTRDTFVVGLSDDAWASAVVSRNLIWFYQQVRNKGPWDYKQLGEKREYENFGNFNYGATGAALDLGLSELLQAAGWAQTRSQTSREGFGSPGVLFMPWTGEPPYGDDPTDQYWIKQGYDYYHQEKRGKP